MVKIKKETISREAFEREMDEIKSFIKENSPRIEFGDALIEKINNAKNRLIEYIDEKDAEKFRIPEWLNQDVTVTVQAKEIG